MALIRCPECNREISQTAGSCPGCGTAIAHIECYGCLGVLKPTYPAHLDACPTCGAMKPLLGQIGLRVCVFEPNLGTISISFNGQHLTNIDEKNPDTWVSPHTGGWNHALLLPSEGVVTVTTSFTRPLFRNSASVRVRVDGAYRRPAMLTVRRAWTHPELFFSSGYEFYFPLPAAPQRSFGVITPLEFGD